MAQVMKDYIRARDKETNLDKLSRIADEMEAHSSKALADPMYYTANPNGAFQFIKRFALDWNRDVAVVLEEIGASQTLLAELAALREHLPSLADLKGTARSIFLIQDSYELNSTNLAKGYISGKRVPSLSAEDCFQLGSLAFDVHSFYHSYQWMKTALDLANDEENKSIFRVVILDYCIRACENKKRFGLALELTKEQLKLDPTLKRALKKKKFYEDKLKRECHSDDIYKEIKRDKNRIARWFRFDKFCPDNFLLQVKYPHHLRCRYYNNNNHPLLVLQPAKEEELLLSPKISLYHDVISEQELSEFKRLAVPMIMSTGKKVFGQADFRIGKSAHVPSDSLALMRINQRTAAITGLVVDPCVLWHASNYGIGGYFQPHLDTGSDNPYDKYSNRIATWLFYLSDVEAGGATVFPSYGLKIFPEKRSAAIWYNYYKNGSVIYRMKHFACPVLTGSKWVSTSWIDITDQMFTGQCSTDPDE